MNEKKFPVHAPEPLEVKGVVKEVERWCSGRHIIDARSRKKHITRTDSAELWLGDD